jgi:hypothetical protein
MLFHPSARRCSKMGSIHLEHHVRVVIRVKENGIRLVQVREQTVDLRIRVLGTDKYKDAEGTYARLSNALEVV